MTKRITIPRPAMLTTLANQIGEKTANAGGIRCQSNCPANTSKQRRLYAPAICHTAHPVWAINHTAKPITSRERSGNRSASISINTRPMKSANTALNVYGGRVLDIVVHQYSVAAKETRAIRYQG